LLPAVQPPTAAQAVGLWRELSLTGRTRWVEVRARGPEELLPAPTQVRAVLEAGVDGELGENTRVLRTGPAGSRFALALGGTGPSHSGIDRAEALLALHVELAASDAGQAGLAAALPQRDAVGRGHGPLGAARRIIAAEGALFAERSIELEAIGFDGEEPRTGLDHEQLAELVRALLLRARRNCEGADAGPCRVVLSVRAWKRGLALGLETNTAGALRPARLDSDLAPARVRGAGGRLRVERPSERSERVRIWIPSRRTG
jgi:hypothetical protein